MEATTEERQEETPHVPLIVVRVQATTDDLDQFIFEYCRYFGSDILFLPTEGVQPPGRRVRFAFALADGTDVIAGEGVVLRMRRDSGNPRRPPGMELRYEVLDEASQEVVDRMLALRTQHLRPPPYLSLSVAETPEPPPAPRPLPNRSVPANPLHGVDDRELGFFVEEAFERITARRRGRALLAFAAGLAVGACAVLAWPREHAPVHRPIPMLARPTPRPPIPQTKSTPAAPVPAEVEIHSEPPGARVILDGVERGRTPARLEVPSGPHALELDRPRYAPAHLQVNAPGRVVVPLERPIATLRVLSTPPGAEVRLRGRILGTTPLEVTKAAYETYALEIARAGHTRHRHLYLQAPSSTLSIDFNQ